MDRAATYRGWGNLSRNLRIHDVRWRNTICRRSEREGSADFHLHAQRTCRSYQARSKMTLQLIKDRLELIRRQACLLVDRSEPTQSAAADEAANCMPIVLFGAGALGQMTLARLRQIGILPVAIVDSDQSRWGTTLDGVPIMAPGEVVGKYKTSASFVVTIYNGSPVRRQLTEWGCDHVLHFVDIFFRFPDQFLPFCGLADRALVLDAWSDVQRAGAVWSDDRSGSEFLAQLAWRLRFPGSETPAPEAPDDCYFPNDLFAFLDDEVIFDCGAFDGDSIRQYLARRPADDRARIVAFEPDPATFARLAEYRLRLPSAMRERIRIEPWAVADTSGEVRFAALGSVRSGVEQLGTATAIGCALDDVGVVPTLIKMDVEGFELAALRGSAQILRNHKPVLAISLYHHASDLWTIPNYLKMLVPDYRFFLRRYAEDCWELILYAVPASRLLDALPAA